MCSLSTMTARPKSTPVTPATDQHDCTRAENGAVFLCAPGRSGYLAAKSLDDHRPVSFLRTEYTDACEVIVMVFAISALNAAIQAPFAWLPAVERGLCIYFDGRPVPHHCIDLFDLAVGHRDTACGPVAFVHWVNAPSRPAMYEDVTTRRFLLRRCKCDVRLVWIRDADGEVEQTVRIAPVNEVGAFGCSSIPLKLLMTFRCKPQPDRIGAQTPSAPSRTSKRSDL